MTNDSFVIIDIGTGNLGSIRNMLKKINKKAIIASKTEDILSAEKIILPGVGSFDSAMKKIQVLHLRPILESQVLKNKVPILGICLGIQMLTKGSEEGILPGLGWIDAKTVRFKFNDPTLKIPHMGWNSAQPLRDDSLFFNMYPDARFYFVHSYHIECINEADILSITHHGYDFVSSVQKGNIYGTQFHPEKSHKFGMKIFQNFAELS